MMHSFFERLFNLIFPPTAIEREIRSLTPASLAERFNPIEAHGVTALFSYHDPLIKQMVWRLKYKNDRYVAKLFGELLREFLLEEFADSYIYDSDTPIIVVPLPLSFFRRASRGYNQAELVVRELQGLDGIAVQTDILKRVRYTKPQTSLRSQRARRENIKGSFRVHASKNIARAHIVLVDDVLTTGSTLREAKRALKDAGVKKVSCLALAH
ncbi:MAG: ComF family protein [Candidatus Pacebacteria bacterium]|nr:ComF family protein [Candidatus Paceibacterota bacterium]